jgi:peptide/nickel transport system ATP-binding protein
LSTAGPLLEIENLKVIFHDDRERTTHAVDCVDLTVRRGKTLGLVGESGCGKSVTALAIMGLWPKGSAQVSGRKAERLRTSKMSSDLKADDRQTSR